MTLAVNFIVNNCFVFKLELMERFGSARHDWAIGSELRDANTISLYWEEITVQIYFKRTGHVCKVLASFKANRKGGIFFLHTSSRSLKCRMASWGNSTDTSLMILAIRLRLDLGAWNQTFYCLVLETFRNTMGLFENQFLQLNLIQPPEKHNRARCARNVFIPVPVFI